MERTTKIIIIVLSLIVLFVLLARTVVFPLAAGTIDSGLLAIKSLKKELSTRKLQNFSLVAAIVEPREKDLVKILSHYLFVLPENTHFQVYHGTKNKCLLQAHFKGHIAAGKISLWNLNVDNLTIQGYSALLTSEPFWQTMQSEQVLIFQTDSITCGNSKLQLTDFSDYDFVGAPLPPHITSMINGLFLAKGYIANHSKFYNGGLSYRKKSKMLSVIRKYPWDELTPEDVWFCIFLPRVGGKLPELDVARKFSYESEVLETVPWGVHKPRKNLKELCEICPEAEEIPSVPAYTDYRNLYML